MNPTDIPADTAGFSAPPFLTPTRYGLLLPPPKLSVLKLLSTLPESDRKAFLAPFTTSELASMQSDWRFIARREQLPPPGDWLIWVLLCGRGWGKTTSISNLLSIWHKYAGKQRTALLARTNEAAWMDVIHGDGGVIAAARNMDFEPEVNRQDRFLRWPNKTITQVFTSEEPERIRGPNLDGAVLDEFASWSVHSDDKMREAWMNLRFCMRVGNPETVIATTPRPRPLLIELIKKLHTVVTGGSTYENEENLAHEFIDELKTVYEGTRIGRQEIHAEILAELQGGLFSRDMIDANRVDPNALPEFKRIVIGVDPAITSTKGSNLTGILAAGLAPDDSVHILGDHSIKGTPSEWSAKVSAVYDMYGADCIIAEKNQGGDMVESTLRSAGENLPIKLVTATRGKILRAEPVAAFAERRKLKFAGKFVELEDELCQYEGGRKRQSPDRMDAAVYAVTELMGGKKKRVGTWGRQLGEGRGCG